MEANFLFLLNFYATFAAEGVPHMMVFNVPWFIFKLVLILLRIPFQNETITTCPMPRIVSIVWQRGMASLLPKQGRKSLRTHVYNPYIYPSAHIANMQDWSRQTAGLTRAVCVHGLSLASRSASSRRTGFGFCE